MSEETTLYWKAVLNRQGIQPTQQDMDRLAAFAPPAAPPPLTPKLATEPQLVQAMQRWEVD